MSLPRLSGLFRLTRDAELKYSQQGTAILKMGLASSEKYGDKETQCFIDATVFGKPAEILNQYSGQKGNQIYLFGKLQTESWEKDGQKNFKHSLIVEGFDFVAGVNCKKETGANAPVVHERKMPENNLPEIDINEDEIPF